MTDELLEKIRSRIHQYDAVSGLDSFSNQERVGHADVILETFEELDRLCSVGERPTDWLPVKEVPAHG